MKNIFRQEKIDLTKLEKVDFNENFDLRLGINTILTQKDNKIRICYDWIGGEFNYFFVCFFIALLILIIVYFPIQKFWNQFSLMSYILFFCAILLTLFLIPTIDKKKFREKDKKEVIFERKGIYFTSTTQNIFIPSGKIVKKYFPADKIDLFIQYHGGREGLSSYKITILFEEKKYAILETTDKNNAIIIADYLLTYLKDYLKVQGNLLERNIKGSVKIKHSKFNYIEIVFWVLLFSCVLIFSGSVVLFIFGMCFCAFLAGQIFLFQK